MFYEEKIICGALCCKTTPDGEWHPVPYRELTSRLMRAKAELSKPRDYIQHVCEETLGTNHDCADYDLLEEVELALKEV